ncbi:MAG: hypothetical protein DRP42_03095, partial [Tenericutes bacterium]
MRYISCYATTALLLLICSSGFTADEWEVHWRHPTPTAGTIYSMFWFSPAHGWLISTMGEILETIDGGETFEISGCTPYDIELFDIFFLDALRGWAVGESGILMETVDGGITWSWTDLGSPDLHEIEFIDES